jgi:hypothetical protein
MRLRGMDEKEEFWRKRVGQWQASGLSLRDFAEREGVGMSSLGAWRRKLAQLDEARGVGLARVQATPPPRAPAIAAAPAIDVVIGGTIVVRVDGQTDLRLLRSVVAALREPTR